MADAQHTPGQWISRIAAKSGAGVNAHAEGERIGQILFSRVGSNVAHAIVLSYLRLCAAQHAAHPHTKTGESEQWLRIIKAVQP